jgi:hypothetical protein
MQVKIDGSEIRVMVDALAEATRVTPAAATAVVAKGALNIKTDARRRTWPPRVRPRRRSSRRRWKT